MLFRYFRTRKSTRDDSCMRSNELDKIIRDEKNKKATSSKAQINLLNNSCLTPEREKNQAIRKSK